MDLDSLCPVDNMSDLTVQRLLDRIERSTTDEHFIYREIELDELWRLVDVAIVDPDRDDGRGEERLRRMLSAIQRAHDLVGMEGKPAEAAAALREVLA